MSISYLTEECACACSQSVFIEPGDYDYKAWEAYEEQKAFHPVCDVCKENMRYSVITK
jgi:hypothetical protein